MDVQVGDKLIYRAVDVVKNSFVLGQAYEIIQVRYQGDYLRLVDLDGYKYTIATRDLFKFVKVKKPLEEPMVVPKFVAEWFSANCSRLDLNLGILLTKVWEEDTRPDESNLKEWVIKHNYEVYDIFKGMAERGFTVVPEYPKLKDIYPIFDPSGHWEFRYIFLGVNNDDPEVEDISVMEAVKRFGDLRVYEVMSASSPWGADEGIQITLIPEEEK